jgi:HprK-related kinase B
MIESTKKIHSLVGFLYNSQLLKHSFLLSFGDCVTQVRTNSKSLAEVLKNYFDTFRTEEEPPHIVVTAYEAPVPSLPHRFVTKPPDPGKTNIKEEFVELEEGRMVRKRLTGMVFVFGPGHNLAVGPCLANYNQVVNFINNRYIEWRLNNGCLLGHAAGVLWNGRGLGLAGFSGMGKSTLALHLLSRGITFLSNDRLMIEKTGDKLVMHGVAKQPRINPGTALNNPDVAGILSDKERSAFAALPEDELWNLEHKYDVPIQQCFGPNRFVLTGPMNGLVILNWNRTTQPLSVNRVDSGERTLLLQAFMKPAGLFYLPADAGRTHDPSVEEYLETLANCPVIELTGGTDFDRAADACLRFLETGDLERD